VLRFCLAFLNKLASVVQAQRNAIKIRTNGAQRLSTKKKAAYVVIKGGFGNQLFQYAKALSLLKHFENVYLFPQCEQQPISRPFYLDDFIQAGYPTIKIKSISFFQSLRLSIARFLNRLNSDIYDITVRYLGVHLNEDLRTTARSLYKTEIFEGYWQNREIVDACKEEIHSKFVTLLDGIDSSAHLFEKSTKFGVIHVRGKDYVNSAENRNSIGLLTPFFYESALKIIEEFQLPKNIYVVTDDLEYTQMLIAPILSGYKYEILSLPILQTWKLMQKAEFVIIGNSTFAWWGAWLCGERKGVVVMPDSWSKSSGESKMTFEKAIKVNSIWSN